MRIGLAVRGAGVLVAALALPACLAPPPPLPASAVAWEAFDPFGFFVGPSHGEGELRVIFSGARALQVRSQGVIAADGTLVIDQTVFEADKPPRARQWRLRYDAPGRYSGTLTDLPDEPEADMEADPEPPVPRPVVAETQRDGSLRIAFATEDGMAVEQRLTLSRDGRSAFNRLTIRKWGFVVARLDERITRD